MKLENILALIFIFFLGTHSFAQQKNDLENMKLADSVKTLNEISYSVKIKKGEITKGPRGRVNIMEKDNAILFNNEGYIVHKREFDKNGKMTGESAFTYDYNNNISQRAIDYFDGSIYFEKDSNVYDNNGNLVGLYCCSEVDSNFSYRDFVLCSTYRYDNSSNKIEEIFNLKDSLSKTKYVYLYDDQNRMIEMSHYRDTLVLKIIYLYSESGELIEEHQFDHKGDRFAFLKYKHNEIGHLVEMQLTFKEAATPLFIFTYEYLYDSHNNWTQRIIYKNGEAVFIVERELTYYK